MQMIVGILLFTPLLLLMPTTLVYYALAVVCYGAVATTGALLQLVQTILTHNPCFVVLAWTLRPGMFTGRSEADDVQAWHLHCFTFNVWTCQC